MKKTLWLIVCLLPAIVQAEPKHHLRQDRAVFYDHARVIDVDPIVEIIRIPIERDECWDETFIDEDAGLEGTIVGGIIGGIIGHQIGEGTGNDAATIAGTLAGAAVGREIDRADRVRHAHRCRKHRIYREQERIVGYWVTYRYHGHVFTTRLDHHPGRRLRLKVILKPAE